MLQLFYATFEQLFGSNYKMEEEVLIKQILEGDLTAFKVLIKQYEQLVAYMVTRIILNEEDVKDITQEIFIKVFKGLPKFGFKSKLSTWIGKIAYHTAISYIKQNNKIIHTDLEDDLPQALMDEETPEKILQSKDEAAVIQFYIAQLPTNYRVVITLYHLSDFSYQEIEEITGMPEGTVKNYLFRARKLLKIKLEKYYRS